MQSRADVYSCIVIVALSDGTDIAFKLHYIALSLQVLTVFFECLFLCNITWLVPLSYKFLHTKKVSANSDKNKCRRVCNNIKQFDGRLYFSI